MKNIYVVLTIVISLFSCFSCKRQESKLILTDLNKICIDPDTCRESFDMSTILSDSVDIIPLETNDNCLIGTIKKLRFTEDYIFISDAVTQQVLMFNRDGSFVQSIGKIGGGSHEYYQLGTFNINGDSIFIQDIASRKYIVFDYHKREYKEDIKYPYHHLELIIQGNTFYELSSYFKFEKGYYNLFVQHLDQKTVDFMLPFPERVNKTSNYFVLNRQMCRNKEQTLFYFPLNDTIYQLDDKGVKAAYEIQFTKRNITLEEKENVDDILLYAHQNGRILHPMYLLQSDRFIMEAYTEGVEFRYLLFDKQENIALISKTIFFSSLGGLGLLGNWFYIDNNEFIMSYPAAAFKLNGSYSLDKEFNSRQRFVKVINQINEDSNPVLFIMKFK